MWPRHWLRGARKGTDTSSLVPRFACVSPFFCSIRMCGRASISRCPVTIGLLQIDFTIPGSALLEGAIRSSGFFESFKPAAIDRISIPNCDIRSTISSGSSPCATPCDLSICRKRPASIGMPCSFMASAMASMSSSVITIPDPPPEDPPRPRHSPPPVPDSQPPPSPLEAPRPPRVDEDSGRP